jgi:hypothetical protein
MVWLAAGRQVRLANVGGRRFAGGGLNWPKYAAILFIAFCARIYWSEGRFNTQKWPFFALNSLKTT